MELLASAKWVLDREGVKTEEKYMIVEKFSFVGSSLCRDTFERNFCI
jgi:hypothetical protein